MRTCDGTCRLLAERLRHIPHADIYRTEYDFSVLSFRESGVLVTYMSLVGKVALVTGGSRGLGAASVRRLAASGADVAIAYLQSEAKAAAIAEDVRSLGGRAAVFQADLADRGQAVNMVDAVAAEFGHIDVLVNSAGIFLPGPLGSLSAADIDRQWAVNVHGLVAATGQALKYMPDGGRIINVGSVAGERAYAAGFGDYSATKAAVSMYGRSWAHELAPRGITVNTVVVAFAETDMVIPPDSDLGKQILAALPFHRYSTPEEVAATVAFLASPEASYMTGGDIRVDGGWNA
jgi:3-oxoacyl-[acyl-carrier protein] reductase